MPIWLTAKEAATYLKLSKSRFYQLVREGKITAYRIAGQGDSRFRQEELDELMTAVPATEAEEQR